MNVVSDVSKWVCEETEKMNVGVNEVMLGVSQCASKRRSMLVKGVRE